MPLRVVVECFLCEKKVWQTPTEAKARAENPRLEPICEEATGLERRCPRCKGEVIEQTGGKDIPAPSVTTRKLFRCEPCAWSFEANG